MENIYKIASFLETGLLVKGYEVNRRKGVTPDSLFISAESYGTRFANIRIADKKAHNFYNFGPFYFITSMEKAERFLREFNSVNS